MDQAFAAFKDSLNIQILAAQAADSHEREELRAQNQALKLRVIDAEKERDKYKSDVAAAEERAKKAEVEAEKYKTQYEELKKNVLSAVGKQV